MVTTSATAKNPSTHLLKWDAVPMAWRSESSANPQRLVFDVKAIEAEMKTSSDKSFFAVEQAIFSRPKVIWILSFPTASTRTFDKEPNQCQIKRLTDLHFPWTLVSESVSSYQHPSEAQPQPGKGSTLFERDADETRERSRSAHFCDDRSENIVKQDYLKKTMTGFCFNGKILAAIVFRDDHEAICVRIVSTRNIKRNRLKCSNNTSMEKRVRFESDLL